MVHGSDGRTAARTTCVQLKRSLPRTLLTVLIVAAALILILLLG